MKYTTRLKYSISLLLSLLLVSLLYLELAAAQTPGSAFTFQGRLRSGTDNINGICRFDFYLFDAITGGNQLAPTITKTGVSVVDSYFTVDLDFGTVFSDAVRYLEVRNVSCGRPGDPVNLTGRIPINPVPAARRAERTGNASTVHWNNIVNMPPSIADGVDDGLDILCADNETLIWVGGVSGGWQCTSLLNDHGHLNGLSDDDHPQYLLVSGVRPMEGDLDLGQNQIITLAPATANGQAVIYEQAVKVGDIAGGDLSGTFPAPIVTQLQGRPVSSTIPTGEQVLTWNGTQWIPANSQAGGLAGGDLSGTYPNPRVSKIQGYKVSSTAPLDKQVLRWNEATAQWEPAHILNNGDAAGGDLAGTYPNPAVIRIQGQLVSNSAPSLNQVLTWNNGRWEPADPQIIGPAGGDLSGFYPNPTVSKLQGKLVSTTTPGNQQVLTWNGSQWTPANILTLQTRDVLDQSPADTQVLTWNGSQWTPSNVTTLQGRPILDIDPNDKQVLQWNGSQWAPGTVFKPGDMVGGDLAGTFPNPILATGVAQMQEVNIPMGYGDGYATWNNTSNPVVTIMPPSASFVPTAPGKCMVFTSAVITSTGSATADPPPFLRTARKVGTTLEDDGSHPMYFSPDDVDDNTPVGISASYVWDITSAQINKTVTFGCYVRISNSSTSDWGNDEQVTCRVSFICM